jgi:insertion element IS1 protein InsB
MTKKDPDLQPVNRSVLHHLHPEQSAVDMCGVEELPQQEGPASERDEMGSDVGKKAAPRWLWHAIEHHSGPVLAYVFGRRKDAVFLQRKALLEPLGIRQFSTDGWGAYARHSDPEQHAVGKEQTQSIASKHSNGRTRIKRLVRRTIGFAKTTTMHDLVIGLFSNRYEFGVAI